MHYNKLFKIMFGILLGMFLFQTYRQFKERPNWALGERLNFLAHYPASADSLLSAQLIIAELNLFDPKNVQLAKSMLEELISQDIKEDIKVRAQIILARHLRTSNPEYAKKLFQEVAQQTININEQLVAKFFIAEQMMNREPLQAQSLFESILDKAKEINKDLYARIMSNLAELVKDSDPVRAKILLEYVSKQDFNKLVKEHAEKALKVV